MQKKHKMWHGTNMNHVIILAAGRGRRMRQSPGYKIHQDKLLLKAGGKPLIYHSLMAFNDHPEIDALILVVNKANKSAIEKIIKAYTFKKIKKIIIGGLTRQKSFAKGFEALRKNLPSEDIVIAHNADNPCISSEEITKVIKGAKENGACILGHYPTSTIKEINGRHIIKTHDRNRLFAAETPQAAQFAIMKKALRNAALKKLEVTDEAMLLEAICQKVSYEEAHENNFKITTPGDLQKLRTIFGDLPEDFRVGLGQDSHEFDKKMGLVFAGLTLPNLPKLKANSDGDVILHAIFNALSQAIGEMSLGFYADDMCEKGIKDSKKYLAIILKKVHQQKFKINTLGLMIECKTPKIDPLATKLKKSLSKILNLPIPRIGITATGGENLTAFGQGLGIQCFAIVSLIK
ncbi:2-C-methyl-D-erythritol 2,4-cyclodiphosphate synthase [Candidatus Peregrinibacteria bacterium]|nr:2-C-methyl-D-erythritol 2,4-cyclodiphosphate synthase [Candidatus Peregrinibacteria bacterium]